MDIGGILQLIKESLPLLLRGAEMTMGLVGACLTFGLMLGVPIAIFRLYGPTWVRFFLSLYDRVFRGFPALVLLFLFYFGVGSFPGAHLSPFIAVLLALGFRSAAYQSQIYRGSLLAVGKGQIDAARSLGLTERQTMWLIVIPQAAYFSLLGLANEYSVLPIFYSCKFVVAFKMALQGLGRGLGTTILPYRAHRRRNCYPCSLQHLAAYSHKRCPEQVALPVVNYLNFFKLHQITQDVPPLEGPASPLQPRG